MKNINISGLFGMLAAMAICVSGVIVQFSDERYDVDGLILVALSIIISRQVNDSRDRIKNINRQKKTNT